MRTVKAELTLRTSIEVDTTALQSKVVVVFFDKGQPFWRLEVIGSKPTRSRQAVGSIAETFQTVSALGSFWLTNCLQFLRRLGLSSFRW